MTAPETPDPLSEFLRRVRERQEARDAIDPPDVAWRRAWKGPANREQPMLPEERHEASRTAEDGTGDPCDL